MRTTTINTPFFGLVFLLSLFCLHAAGQTPPVDTKPLDSIAMSKNLNRAARDTNRFRKSDTVVAIILNRIEGYTVMFNKVISTLKRGYDSSYIVDNMPLVDTSLHVIKRNIATLGSTPNVHDLYTNKVMLVQLERKLDLWQEEVNRYYSKLVQINDTMVQITRDSTMRSIPADDELFDQYKGQIITLVKKFRQADSANKVSLLRLGFLQNNIANRYIDVTNLLEEMDFQLSTFGNRMFNKDYTYLWQRAENAKKAHMFLPVLRSSIVKNLKVLIIFLAVQWQVILIWILVGVLFAWWIFSNIHKIRQRHPETEAESILQHSRYVYRFPLASMLIVVFTLSSFISIRYPLMYTELNWGVTIAALTLVLYSYLPSNFFRWWVVLTVLLFLYCVNNLLIEATFVEHWALFAGAIFCIVLGIRLLKATKHTTLALPRYSRAVIWLFIVMSSISLLMVLIARVTAAKIIGASSVINIVMAVNLMVFIEILMEAVYLQVEANKNSSTFISFIDYQRVKSKLKNMFTILAAIAWLTLIARNLYVFDAIFDSLSVFLGKERKIGNTAFSYGSILVFLVVIWVATIVTQLISYFFGNTGEPSGTFKKGKLGSAMLLVRLGVLTIGVLIAFAASGIPMDKLAIVIGALGVGIGFGLQNVVNNLVSGIILAFEKPIEVGDVIELGTRSGVVKEIGIRSSKISAYDGSDVVVPNGDLISQQLINWTLSGRTRRLELLIGVAYGADVQQVITIMKESIVGREGVLTLPEPVVFLSQFGDNAINFRIFLWISDLGLAGSLQSDILADIYQQLQAAGIRIPNPQRELHIRSIDPKLWQRWEADLHQQREAAPKDSGKGPDHPPSPRGDVSEGDVPPVVPPVPSS
ncbi:mechanosensitive ion channel [Chitinophaga pendula]|uniref:mechanosensitive ion channel family protein n=1 Tax=Chitinophaga TaxID=79328 RepID=UPI000BAFF11D|nr:MULTISPECIES: mechanosensitive ion channel domain-containing protein [Chitinophaga]ASZ11268.1 hypothetical protein CK934_09965 [Chitinophaga sp. MD30]UCJ05732.1 mechanosensitive ion channel [Chitinophaga pendula]